MDQIDKDSLERLEVAIMHLIRLLPEENYNRCIKDLKNLSDKQYQRRHGHEL